MNKVFHHSNHEAAALTEDEFVDLTQRKPRPDIFATKLEFVKWCSDPQTDHCFYSFWEPRDSTSRLTKENGPAFLHGFCADFDVHHLDETALARAIVDCPPAFPVAYVSRTFNKGIRMVWLFEKPLPVFNEEVAIGVANRAIRELKLKKLAPGFDEEAFLDLAKYYEIGSDWRACSPEKTIPSSYLATWAFEASQKADFRKEGTSIPIDVVEAEAAKRWPGRWSGTFAVGSKGIRFWDPTATNETGAWIRETGVQAFTGECRFLHWSEIFGKDWVKQFEAERIGLAIDNIWFAAKEYWWKDKQDKWQHDNCDQLRRALHCRGMVAEKQRGAASELERAIHDVERNHRLDGAYPFLYSKEDIVPLRGERYLNISRVRPTQPAMGAHYWGEGFPWLAKCLEGMLGPEQLPILLSWFAHAYQGALKGNARQGHALFIAGPTDSGKTLINQRVIGEALGGFSDGTNFVTGDDKFNGELFKSGVWAIDDAKVVADRQHHELYSQIVKMVVANPSMNYRRMYCDGLTLPWKGRLVVTLNMNAIQMLPNIESELMDKVIFMKVTTPDLEFGTNAVCEARITKELPALLAHLRDWVIPGELKDAKSDRFGMKAWHHPDLMAEAKADAPSAEIAEIVEQFRVEYFGQFPEKDFWEGSAQQLMRELKMIDRDTIRETIRSPRLLGKRLTELIAQGTPWLTRRRTSANWLYMILNPRYSRPPTTIVEYVDSQSPGTPDEWGCGFGREVVADGNELACQNP